MNDIVVWLIFVALVWIGSAAHRIADRLEAIAKALERDAAGS